MNGKKYSNLDMVLVNVFIYTVFIVLCDSGFGGENEINWTLHGKNSSAILLSRGRRAIRRGQNYYFQRGYDLNRLRYENLKRYLEPRIKPYFHRVNEVYSYYLPKHLNYKNSFENFGSPRNQNYGTKSKPKTRPKDHVYSFNKRLLPTASYQSRIEPKSPKQIDPISGVQQNYRPQYQQYFRQGNGREQDPGSSSSYSSFSVSSSDYSSSDYSSSDYSSPDYSWQDYSRLIPESQNVQNVAVGRNSTFDGIPGWIRRDYPGYNKVPYTGFRCEFQPYYGYYADINAGCQVFHICQSDGRHDSFLCPNGTLFHQKAMTCDWWYYVDCPSSPNFYYLNARIGVLPPQPATLSRFD